MYSIRCSSANIGSIRDDFAGSNSLLGYCEFRNQFAAVGVVEG